MYRTIRLTLYRPHDYDLYCLYFDTRFRFNEAVRAVLAAYVYGLDPPRIDVTWVAPLRKGHEKIVSVGVQIKDPKILEMWDYMFTHGRSGNNFVKSLLRRSLVGLEGLYFQNAEGEYQDPRLKEDHNDIFETKNYPAKWSESEAARKAREEEAKELTHNGTDPNYAALNETIADLQAQVQILTKENKKGSKRENKAKSSLKERNAELKKIKKELAAAEKRVSDAEAAAVEAEGLIRKRVDEVRAKSRFELDAVYEKAAAIEKENQELKERIRLLEEKTSNGGSGYKETVQIGDELNGEISVQTPITDFVGPTDAGDSATESVSVSKQDKPAENKAASEGQQKPAKKPESIFDIADNIIAQFL